MKHTSIPTLVGAFISLLIIWALHTLLIVDDCVEQGGDFQYNYGTCQLENGQLYQSDLVIMALILYCIIALSVSLLVSKIIRNIFKIY